MSAYSKDLSKFADQNAQVVGISPDSHYSHLAWQEKSIGWQDFPMACDYWPHAGTAQKYGILREGPPLPGINDRAVFIVDKQGTIRFVEKHRRGELPEPDKVLAEVKKLS